MAASKANSTPRKAPRSAARSWHRWLPWAALGLCVAALMSAATIGPGRLFGMLKELVSPRPHSPLTSTILHSNDTWGYIFPRG